MAHGVPVGSLPRPPSSAGNRALPYGSKPGLWTEEVEPGAPKRRSTATGPLVQGGRGGRDTTGRVREGSDGCNSTHSSNTSPRTLTFDWSCACLRSPLRGAPARPTPGAPQESGSRRATVLARSTAKHRRRAGAAPVSTRDGDAACCMFPIHAVLLPPPLGQSARTLSGPCQEPSPDATSESTRSAPHTPKP